MLFDNLILTKMSGVFSFTIALTGPLLNVMTPTTAAMLTFQQGVNHYQGTQDTSIRWAFEAHYWSTENPDGTLMPKNPEGPHSRIGAYDYLYTNAGASTVLEVGRFFNKGVGFAGRPGPVIRFSG